MDNVIAEFLSRNRINHEDIDMAVEVKKFIAEMERGLCSDDSSLDMIPTYLTLKEGSVADKKTMVIDAGGTNLRVGSIAFDEHSNPHLDNFSNTEMIGRKKELSKEEFFGAMVDYIKDVAKDSEKIGFCFSYAAEVDENQDATLIKWSKEVKAPEVIGEKVGKNIIDRLKNLDGKDRSIVVLNDTVATLLGGKAITPNRVFDSYIGFIFGTGTNICYVEDVANISKIAYDKDHTMIINVESGAYNKLPRSPIDEAYDSTTGNPGDYQFEKMVSGRYLGELIVQVIKAAAEAGQFSDDYSEHIRGIGDCELKDFNLFMYNPHFENDVVGTDVMDEKDREVLYHIIDAMIERAAKFCAIKLISAILKTGKGLSPTKPVAIVAEGTTFFKLKGYQESLMYYMKSYLTGENTRYYEFLSGDNLNLYGTAVAALSKN